MLILLLQYPVLCQAEGLLDIYKRSKANDVQMKVASLDIEVANEVVNSNRSLMLPQVNLSSDISHTRTSQYPNSSNPFSISRERVTDLSGVRYSISATQAIYDRTVSKALESSKHSARRAKLNSAKTELDLKFDVAEAYLNIIRAEENLKSIKHTELTFKNNLELIKSRVKLGLARVPELKEAVAFYDASVVERIAAENEVLVLKNRLSVFTGHTISDVSGRFCLEKSITGHTLESLEYWKNAALNGNLDLQVVQAGIHQAESTRQALQANHLPKVYGQVSYSDMDMERQFDFNVPDTLYQDGWSISLSVTLPLYSGGRISAQAKQAQLELSKLKQTLTLVKRQVLQAVTASFSGYSSGLAALRASKRAVFSRQDSLSAAKDEYLSGLINVQDLIDAQTALYASKRRFVEARYQFHIASLRLQQITGQLDENSLTHLDKLTLPGASTCS